MIDLVRRFVIPQAFALLPPKMASREAAALLLAIGVQESKFQRRRQLADGPARGFWQFERSGALSVLLHKSTGLLASDVLQQLAYPPDPAGGVHALLEHNDVLAAVFARLYLYTDASPLPKRTESALGWQIYLRTWRPGKPKPATWSGCFSTAWSLVDQGKASA